MNLRRSCRTSVPLKVIVFNDGLPVAVGKTKNISKAGLFVRTTYREVDLLQALEIQFATMRQRSPSKVRVKARVVHKTEVGFGLELVDSSSAAHDAMTALLEMEGARIERRIEVRKIRSRVSA